MKTALRTPKLLPWLARKARISDTCAVELWQRALAETATQGPMVPARVHSMALDRLLVLVAAESLRQRAPFHQLSAGFRLQARLWRLRINFWGAAFKALQHPVQRPSQDHRDAIVNSVR